ncbi:MAG: metalloregulator ArsR/SmtB family transcription factor [Kiritimatiellales bacterium]|nr:metalloregulator ArsR/SmtB family transcription factor [Kiritimatiellales bacterium]
MSVDYRELEKQLKAVANARRLYVLSFIKKSKSATVSEISDNARMSIEGASQHLRILRMAGIVEQKKRGQFVSYRISLKQSEPIKKILALL